MKRLIIIAVAICIMFSVTACSLFPGFGSFHETSAEQYGKWKTSLSVPSFLPKSIKDYRVNSYSYTLDNYLDTCYEIFLDITVDEAEFKELLEKARSYSDNYTERSADYCDGYTEIVFTDYYERGETDESDNLEQVGWADIEKVIYNSNTNSIVYVVFHANDTGVYDVEDVAYFNRFSITTDYYEQFLIKTN